MAEADAAAELTAQINAMRKTELRDELYRHGLWFDNHVIFAKLYLPTKDLTTIPLTHKNLVASGAEAKVCVRVLPPRLPENADITDIRDRDDKRLQLVRSAWINPPSHPWDIIKIKDMVDKGLIYSRTLREGEVELAEGNVGIYLSGTTHYWYKIQPSDVLSHYKSRYRKPVHGDMDNRPTTVANADIHWGYVTIVSEQEGNERFIQVMRFELQPPTVPALGGNKYSRKHKSTKRTKKQNSRRNRRRYRTRNRR